ncbi:putative membrane protein [Chamaesiphon minutus PCC 6605]|uniref:Putative membrane protein n=2 Tax=Chamaesiphon TaxID=217161 RepID=K9UIL1_CHAP6|nr:putative membrane protein [Chamaesiphon minutus PCC 6605]
MIDKLRALLKPMVKTLVAVGLVLTLVFAQTGDAFAARSGGRIGGGSFRSPSRGYSSPGNSYPSRGGGGYYPGGGFSPFFFLPFIGGGGGSLLSLFVMIAIGGFLVNTFRRVAGGDNFEGDVYNPQVSIAQIQVGLLAEARNVQSKLDQLAETVNADTASGRMYLLQETSLELLRHPEYWTYGKTGVQQAKLDRAEAVFNQLSLNERGKFTTETLSNVNNQLRQAQTNATLNSTGELVTVEQEQERSEYIIVTLLVAATRPLQLPKINGQDDLRQALQTLGSLDGSALVAVEAIWTPQANGDALTTDDILAHYPDLKLV